MASQSDLGLRIENLEDRFNEMSQKTTGPRGPVGPRGPAGPIDAAVRNATVAANQTVADAEARVTARSDAAIMALRQEVKQLKDFINQNIQTAVDNGVVKVLEDYGVKDRNGDPIKY